MNDQLVWGKYPKRAENAVTRENDLWREEIEGKAQDIKREVKNDLWSFRQ